MHNIFERSCTYDCDLSLFKHLDLEPFDIKNQEEYNVGTVVLELGSKVRLWVTCAPAQFWRAEIFCKESGLIFSLATGSGSLADYWKTFKAVAEGMVVIKEIRPALSKKKGKKQWEEK